MRATHTCGVNELNVFAEKHLNISEGQARMQVKERFFPECEKLVIFQHEKYVKLNTNENEEDEYGNYDRLAGMIVAFLDFHNIKECFITDQIIDNLFSNSISCLKC